jgi:hypothetical protein
MLTRWPAFARFLEDGRICLTNNAAERALRGLALGRKSWLFAGSERGAERAAIMYTLIQTAKLNEIDPQAWLAASLSRSPRRRRPGSATPILELDVRPPLARRRLIAALGGGLQLNFHRGRQFRRCKKTALRARRPSSLADTYCR